VTLAGSLTIRRARRADVAAIVAMLADDHLGSGRERFADPLPESYYQAFDAIARTPAIRIMVADDAGVVVGCLQLCVLPGLSSQGASRALVEDVRVASDRRGQRIGEQLLRWAIDQARADGCKLIELLTHRSRVDAQRFYARLGFEPSHVGMTLRF
jgi:GNAT superfamily N-acetyltransferase